MRYSWMICLFVLFFVERVGAQCPVYNITINNQFQIDDFPTNYPNCKNFRTLTISGNVSSLDGLIQLNSIDNLTIFSNSGLTNLKGLENTQHINKVSLVGNAILKDLKGLNNLASAESILIQDNAFLKDLKGLDNLATAESILIKDNDSLKELFSINCKSKSINTISIINNDKLLGIDFTNIITRFNQLNIQENDALTYIRIGQAIVPNTIQINIIENENLLEIVANRFEQINTLNVIGNSELVNIGSYDLLNRIDTFRIESNPKLEILTGLNSLRFVTNISIIQNNNLKSLKALRKLNYINGDLIVSNNDNLQELFEDVHKVNKSINITHNKALTNINGLRNCYKLTNLILVNNPILEECTIQSICDAFESKAQIYIYNNNEGCKRNYEVKQKCIYSSENIYPNPALDHLYFFDQYIEELKDITIYDMQGRLIHFKRTKQNSIDISGLTIGIYYLEVSSDQLNFKQKFIKY